MQNERKRVRDGTTRARMGAGALVAGLLFLAACASEPAPKERVVDPEVGAIMEGVRQAYLDGQYRAALALTDSVERRDPDLPELYFYRGLVYTEISGLAQAEAAFDKVRTLDPNYPGIWYKLGHTVFLQGKYEEAIRRYRTEEALVRKAVKKAEDADARKAEQAALSAVLVQLGRTYWLLNRADSARFCYEQSLAQDSTNATAYAWLGELDEDEGRNDEALANARRAARLDPENLEYRHRTGTLLFQSGQYLEAALVLDELLRRQPAHTGANYKMGQALMQIGRTEQAQPYLERAETLQKLEQKVSEAQATAYHFPEDPEKWVALANLFVTSGRYEEAMNAFRVALFLVPRSLALYNDIANLTLAMGDTENAVLRYRQVLSLDSTFADGWLNLGVAYAQAGEHDAARKAWQQALHFEPNHPEAKAYLTQLGE